MTTDSDACGLRIPAETLAAWYDGTLGEDEARRVREHVPTCEICRSRLAGYGMSDQAIRQQRVPDRTGQLWWDIRAGMNGSGHVRQGNHRRRHLLESLGVVAAAILVVVGFARVFANRPGQQIASARTTPTATVSALPVPGKAPSWQSHSPAIHVVLPPQTTHPEPPQSYGLAVSASDGATAYFCYPLLIPGGNGVTQAEVWVTHDLAAHWTYVSNLPFLGTGSSVADSCSLQVDTLDSNRLLATFYSAAPASHVVPGFIAWFASTDGGVTWTTMQVHHSSQYSGTYTSYADLGTADGLSYALSTTTSPWPAGVATPTPLPNLNPRFANHSYDTYIEQHLVVSSDGMRTWHPIDQPLLARVGPNHEVEQVWEQVGPDGQMILLADVGVSYFEDFLPHTLWESQDGGADWTELSAPPLEDFMAQSPVAGYSWYICGQNWTAVEYAKTFVAKSFRTECSMNGGKTWSTRPQLETCQGCYALFPGNGGFLARDGSLVDLQSPFDRVQTWGLYRLPSNSSQWQYLGPLPGMGLIYAPAKSPAVAGYLWSFQSGGYGGLSSDVQVAGLGRPNNFDSLYTAAYPT